MVRMCDLAAALGKPVYTSMQLLCATKPPTKTKYKRPELESPRTDGQHPSSAIRCARAGHSELHEEVHSSQRPEVAYLERQLNVILEAMRWTLPAPGARTPSDHQDTWSLLLCGQGVVRERYSKCQ